MLSASEQGRSSGFQDGEHGRSMLIALGSTTNRGRLWPQSGSPSAADHSDLPRFVVLPLVAARFIVLVGHPATRKRPFTPHRRPAQARERQFCTNAKGRTTADQQKPRAKAHGRTPALGGHLLRRDGCGAVVDVAEAEGRARACPSTSTMWGSSQIAGPASATSRVARTCSFASLHSGGLGRPFSFPAVRPLL